MGRVPLVAVGLPVLDGEAAGGLVPDRDALSACFAYDTSASVLVGWRRALIGTGICSGPRVGAGAFGFLGTCRGAWVWFLPFLWDASRLNMSASDRSYSK